MSIGLVISLGQGIIHPYYAVALAPPLGALVGIATMGLWQRRATWVGRVGLAAGLGATVVWSYVLLGRTSNWFPALRPSVVVVGALGVLAILALPLLHHIPKLAVVLVAVLGFGAALAAPLFSTVATAATAHNGAIPSVTPTPAGGGGPRRRLPRRRRRLSWGWRISPGLRRRRLPRRHAGRGLPRRGRLPGPHGSRRRDGRGRPPRWIRWRWRVPSSGRIRWRWRWRCGFLNSSQSNPALTKALQADAVDFKWVAATVNSNNAAGYQLASDDPVMAIGGFNGTDPAPTLAQFEADVSAGEIHYFIASGGGGGGFGGESASAAVGPPTTRRRSPAGSNRTSRRRPSTA